MMSSIVIPKATHKIIILLISSGAHDFRFLGDLLRCYLSERSARGSGQGGVKVVFQTYSIPQQRVDDDVDINDAI